MTAKLSPSTFRNRHNQENVTFASKQESGTDCNSASEETRITHSCSSRRPHVFLTRLSCKTTKKKGDRLLLQLSFRGLKCHAHRNWPPPSHFLPSARRGDSQNTNVANASRGAALSRSYGRALRGGRKSLFGFKFHTSLKRNT